MNLKYGLSSEEAEKNTLKYGNNALSVKESQSLLSMFIDSFKDKWIIILLLALAIKITFVFIGILFPVLGGENWYDAASILAAILLSTGFSTVSSYKNEQKFNTLQAEASKTNAKVYRDGELKEMLIDNITMFDCIMLQAGDKIPVDGIVKYGEIKVDQSALNGESEEATKRVASNENMTPNFENTYDEFTVFRGSIVSSGEAIIEARVIGDETMLGKIGASLNEATKESPSKEKLNKLADNIGVLGYSGGAISAIINMVLGLIALNTTNNISFGSVVLLLMETIMLGVSIVIMAVPEGLPMMMALVSSMNSGKLLSQNILVRHSDTIETAGYMNILFSDKTGTITEGKLSVVGLLTGDGNELGDIKTIKDSLKHELINGIGLNNDAFISEGKAIGSNSTDRALMTFLINNNATQFDTNKVIEKKAFSSATKFASVSTSDNITYIKGAPELLINDKCKYYLDENGTKKTFTAKTKTTLNEQCLKQANRAMRLLAIMSKPTNENETTLIAIVCIRDNVRTGTDNTVEIMNTAGVQVVMVTGDRKETAIAIAKEANIICSDDDITLTHEELDALSDDELKDILPRLKVVSRALPMDKKRLVKCAQELDLVAGMTGDGVNDAPALKAADVGFSVGDGTETAKEASDIVILNNSLASIEKAILFGRTMSKSISKFIIFQLTVNVSTILMAILAPLFGWTEPFTIVQILWINLIMDTLAALAFGEEPALNRYMLEKPISRKASLLTKYIKSSISTAAIFITIGCLAILLNVGNIHNFIIEEGIDNNASIRTFMFTFFIYSIIFNSLNTRSHGFNLFEHIGQNKKFIIVMSGIAIAQSLIIQFGGTVFSTVPMSLQHFGLALALAALIIPVDFIRKAIIKE